MRVTAKYIGKDLALNFGETYYLKIKNHSESSFDIYIDKYHFLCYGVVDLLNNFSEISKI